MSQIRRIRSDGTAGHLNAFERAQLKIEPPVPLSEPLMVLWREIIEGRAAFEWSKIDLRLAVTLVRAMADLDAEQRMLAKEPKVKRTPHGPVANPRLAVVKQ